MVGKPDTRYICFVVLDFWGDPRFRGLLDTLGRHPATFLLMHGAVPLEVGAPPSSLDALWPYGAQFGEASTTLETVFRAHGPR